MIGVASFNIPVNAQTSGEVPGQALGLNSDADLWRFIRNGNSGNISMQNELAAVMIQSEGDNWRAAKWPIFNFGVLGVWNDWPFGCLLCLEGSYKN